MVMIFDLAKLRRLDIFKKEMFSGPPTPTSTNCVNLVN